MKSFTFVSSSMSIRPLPRRPMNELRVYSSAESEVTIRRRPPSGYTGQRCGSLMFEVQQEDKAKPRNILEEIVWSKDEEVKNMRSSQPVETLMKLIRNLPAPKDFRGALLETYKKDGRPAVIAEVKKASPSKGVIQPNFDPVAIARNYERGGATCLSVLTDSKYFQGGFENLRLIREAGVTCPLLCKEFIVDGYQLFKARASGADAVLLIAAVLSNKDLDYFVKSVSNLGMQCLIEVHDENELERVSKLDSLEDHIVGINNRNLETFQVDMKTTSNLLKTPTGQQILDQGIIVVGESGIHTSADIDTLHNAGCKAVLVGESLVKTDDQEKALADLVKLNP